LAPIFVLFGLWPSRLHHRLGHGATALGIDVAQGPQINELLLALRDQPSPHASRANDGGFDRTAFDRAARRRRDAKSEERRRPRNRFQEIASPLFLLLISKIHG